MRDKNADGDAIKMRIGLAEKASKRLRARIAKGDESKGPSTLGELLTEREIEAVRLRYSLGDPLDELEQRFRAAMATLFEHNAKQATGGHQLSFELVGMAHLFGCDDLAPDFLDLWSITLTTGGRKSYLLGQTRSWGPNDPPTHKHEQRIRDLIDTVIDHPDRGADAIETHVRKHWYNSWRAQGNWGTHHGNCNGYIGYWAFDIAAIAHKNQVDDSALKDHKYYPYDLAHYLD